MIDRLFDRINFLEKGLDASFQKNDVIANNIANVDTPNFKSSSVEFESVFREALSSREANASRSSAGASPAITRTSAFIQGSGDSPAKGGGFTASLNDLEPNVRRLDSNAHRMDGNSVDIDAEMTELAKNSILYDTLSYVASKELGRLRIIINEGK